MDRNSRGVRLIERAQVGQFFFEGITFPHLDSTRGQTLAQAEEFLRRQPIGSLRVITRTHHLGQINHGVPRHCKGDLGLFIAQIIDTSHDQALASRIVVSAPSQDWLLCCERK